MSELLHEKTFQDIRFEVYNDKPKFHNLFQVHQTHSPIIVELSPENCLTEADGIIFKNTELKKSCIAIKTADCLPIVYIGKNQSALVHAGWRGVHLKIHLTESLKKLEPTDIYIGPCIHSESFEVTQEFRDHFPNSPYFTEVDGKLYFDLVQHTLSELKEFFPAANITQSGICTFKNNQYNSYRRNKTTKRNWNILKTKGTL